MASRTTPSVLTLRELNRATLARQPLPDFAQRQKAVFGGAAFTSEQIDASLRANKGKA